MIEGQFAAIAAVRATLPDVSHAVDDAVPRLGRGGRLAYAGAGTSGRIGVQDGVELTPTFRWPADRLVFFLAGGEASPTRSSEEHTSALQSLMRSSHAVFCLKKKTQNSI